MYQLTGMVVSVMSKYDLLGGKVILIGIFVIGAIIRSSSAIAAIVLDLTEREHYIYIVIFLEMNIV